MNLNLLNYNNYFNRIVKKFDTLAEYKPFLLSVVENINFNPGDGVGTKQIVNYDGNTQPNYVVVDDGANIVSRWFILDSNFVRRGQYELTLYRDTIADNLDEIVDAPMFVEKATVSQNDPAIFNKEDMTFNQIKTQEIPLKDETGTPWIVGYIPSDAFDADTVVNSTFVKAADADIQVDSLSSWKYYNYTQNSTVRKKPITKLDMEYIGRFNYKLQGFTSDEYDFQAGKGQITFDKNGNVYNRAWYGPAPQYPRNLGSGNYTMSGDGGWFSAGREYLSKYNKTIYPNLAAEYLCRAVENHKTATLAALNPVRDAELKSLGSYVWDDAVINELLALNGKTIYDKGNKMLFQISVVKKQMVSGNPIELTQTSAKLKQAFPILNDTIQYKSIITTPNTGNLQEAWALLKSGEYVELNLQERSINIKTTVLGTKNRTHLVDAPYDMFCMPYDEGFEVTDAGKTIKNTQFAALNMAIGVAAKTGGKNVYDVQLLPYCPIRNAIKGNKFDITGVPHNAITDSEGKTIYSYMIWCDKSDFTFDITHSIAIPDKKISNECDVYRLCSPNYASMFEFSPAKNNGVSTFNVDCTYKPWSPYIHVNPNFGGLYGRDFNDARGLILNGDFSITQLSSAWADYELTNKNFQASFDRQIQSMELNNKYQKMSDQINALVGVGTAAFAGGMMGKMGQGGFLGLGSGVVGGTIAATGSAIAGQKDIEINELLRNEAIDLAKDQFGYQLGNIQAIPYALTKTTALTANNKLFPFLEYYTCTEEEKQALRNKIKYNGMTVMRIGSIAEFKQPQRTYIKGKLIRLENIDDDYHLINTIAGELNKGIFI